MKSFRQLACILVALACVIVTGYPASAHTATAELLQRRVRGAVREAAISYARLYNIDSVSGADLRDAAQSALEGGGKVFFNFDTLDNNRVVGRTVVNPHLVSESSDDFNFILDLASDEVAAVQEIFTKHLERPVAVLGTNMVDFGMCVILSAKLDLAGMDSGNLIAYSYDIKANIYQEIEDANCTVDQYGFLSLQTTRGGYIVITAA